MRRGSIGALGMVAGFMLGAPVLAGDEPASSARADRLPAPHVLFQGMVREEDVSLLFAHLRAALLAARDGREAPPPEALRRRAEALAGELRTRGALAGLQLLSALEAAARESLREPHEPPSAAPR